MICHMTSSCCIAAAGARRPCPLHTRQPPGAHPAAVAGRADELVLVASVHFPLPFSARELLLVLLCGAAILTHPVPMYTSNDSESTYIHTYSESDADPDRCFGYSCQEEVIDQR